MSGQSAARAPKLDNSVGYIVAFADTAVQLSVFIYLYRALRHVYRSGLVGTAGRVVVLMGGYLGILILLGGLVLRLNTVIGGL